MSRVDLRDAAGGYGTEMHEVQMDMRANTLYGDREKDEIVNFPAHEAERLCNMGVAHLTHRATRQASAARARAAKAARRGLADEIGAESGMVTGGDHTRSVARS